MKTYWIFFIVITTLCIRAKGDVAALEKKMEMFERQLKSYDSRLKSHESRDSDHDTRLESYNARLEQLESKSFSCNTTMYSFSTRLHEDTDTSDAAIIFGTVKVNVGNGYDEFTGVFHAPVSGLYLLSVYARTAGDDGYIFIKKNDDVVCRTGVTLGNSGADNLGHDTGICTGITKLIPEDSVRVTGDSGYPARIQANDSGFIGHLIQPYC